MAEVRDVADQAQQRAQDAKGQAKARVREQVDQRSTQAGEQVGGAASDMRSVAEELRNQGKDTPARYAEQAADRVERIGGYLRDADGDRILRDAEDLGRRQPWVVIAGGLALGFAASRVLKASSADRYRSSQADGASERGLPAHAGVPGDGGEPIASGGPPAYPSAGAVPRA